MSDPTSATGPTGHSDPIETYLARLAAAGYGIDAALLHDIIADAEDHLRNAVRDGMTAQAAVEAFGRPEDVVRAYAQVETSRRIGRPAAPPPPPLPPIPPAHAPFADSALPPQQAQPTGPTTFTPPPARRPWLACIPIVGIWFDCHAWGSLLFFILGIAPALVYFTVLVTGITLGLGFVPIVVGLPILVLVLGIARAMALFHGQLIERMTGVRMPRRYAARSAAAGTSPMRRVVLWLTDGRSWLSAAFLVGNLPVAMFLFSLFVSLAAFGVAALAVPVASLFSHTTIRWSSDVELNYFFWHLTPDATGYIHFPPDAVWFGVVVGLTVATLTLYLARAVGWLYAQAAKAIQVTRPTMA